MSKRIVVAIDGPAGAGKSTVAKRLAGRLGFIYIDTGAMYRAVALWALAANLSLDEHHKIEELARQSDIQFEPGTDRVFLNGDDVTDQLRTPEVTASASRVSAIPAVRRILVEKQRLLGAESSVVMEGRDIGTVVFPDAQVKVFLDAPAHVRAERRTLELKLDSERTATEMAERDQRDRNRSEAPLVQAADAVYIDSEIISADEVVEAILKLIRDRTSNGKEFAR